MLRFKILFSVSLGILIYVIVSVLGGPNGFWAMKQLEQQKQQISLHKAELDKLNMELQIEHSSLKNDNDVIAAYARKLGYISEGEKLLKISGLTPYYTPLYDAGTVMKSVPVSFIPEWICKLFGCIVGILMFILLMLKDISKEPVKKNMPSPYEAGIKTSSYESIGGIEVEII